MYFEVCIQKHHAGFNMWQTGEANGDGWADEESLVDAIAQNTYEMLELGSNRETEEAEPSSLWDEAHDIRGMIYEEPARVFAIRRTSQNDPIEYVGIVERSRDT